MGTLLRVCAIISATLAVACCAQAAVSSIVVRRTRCDQCRGPASADFPATTSDGFCRCSCAASRGGRVCELPATANATVRIVFANVTAAQRTELFSSDKKAIQIMRGMGLPVAAPRDRAVHPVLRLLVAEDAGKTGIHYLFNFLVFNNNGDGRRLPEEFLAAVNSASPPAWVAAASIHAADWHVVVASPPGKHAPLDETDFNWLSEAVIATIVGIVVAVVMPVLEFGVFQSCEACRDPPTPPPSQEVAGENPLALGVGAVDAVPVLPGHVPVAVDAMPIAEAVEPPPLVKKGPAPLPGDDPDGVATSE